MATILDSTEEPSRHLNSNHHHLNGVDAAKVVRLSRTATTAAFWRNPALRELCEKGASPAEVWKAYWKTGRPKPVAKLCRSSGTPLTWGLNRQALSPACRELLGAVDDCANGKGRGKRSARRRQLQPVLAAWLDEARVTPPTWHLAVGCLAAAHLLGEAGRWLDAALGWETLDFLHATAAQPQQRRLDAATADDDGLTPQLLAGELPLALSHYFSEMAPLKALRAGARERLSEGLFELLNGEGLVQARRLDSFPALVACWTRCCAMGTKIKKGCWSAPAQKRFRALVRQVVRWTDESGRVLLSGEKCEPWSRDLLRTALQLGGRPADAAAARRLLGSRKIGKADSAADAKLPKPSYHCEWSALAVLRSEWAPSSPVVAVDYWGRDMRLDVHAGRQRLFQGVWADISHVNGRPLAAADKWEQLCWVTDKDVD